MANSARILLVEDNPDDAALTELALRRGWPAELEVARNAQEAVDYLFGDTKEVPRLVLLDLALPGTGGFEVLRRIRENERTRLIPVVALTSLMSPDDVAESYRLGANGYVRKPVEFDRFSDRIREVGAYWLGINEPLSNGRAT